MVSIDLQHEAFKTSDFAVISSSDRDTYRREKVVTVKDRDGLSLKLNLHYL
jgi:vacuolar protein sorting-associated protein 13A/C